MYNTYLYVQFIYIFICINFFTLILELNLSRKCFILCFYLFSWQLSTSLHDEKNGPRLSLFE